MPVQNKGFGLLFEMGTGKTLASIAIFGRLYLDGFASRVLIVAPASVCSVWEEELEAAADFSYRIALLQGTKQKRLKALAELVADQSDALKVAVINYESTYRDGLFDALKDFDADLIICDESQRIKNFKARQSKAMHELGDLARFKMILSGTPVQQNAMDLWSQYRFMDRTIFGDKYYSFRARYAVMGGFENRQVIALKHKDELIAKEYERAYRVTKDEAIDLPEQIFTRRVIELEPKAAAVYKEIKKNAYAELNSGDRVTAPTVLTKMLRLQQITGGFLQTEEAEKPTPISDAKLAALSDIIEDYCETEGKKLVVFVRFIPEVSHIRRMLEKKGINYRMLYGEIKDSDRGQAVKDFQEDESVKVMVAQIQCAGLGITLTAASTCVYYSVDFNYANYQQSLARIHRAGQKNACQYIHLVCKNTIDSYVLKALEKKKDIAADIVDGWREIFK